MASNRITLDRLFDEGGVDLQRSPFLHQAPPALSRSMDFAKVEGMLLGLAVGDALGVPTEGLLADHTELFKQFSDNSSFRK